MNRQAVQRWVSLLGEREPVTYGVLMGMELARTASEDGTVQANLETLDGFLRQRQGCSSRKITAGSVVLSLAETGWLQVVDIDRMIFRLALPARLGRPLEPTEYVRADAYKRPVGRRKHMKPQKVKA